MIKVHRATPYFKDGFIKKLLDETIQIELFVN